MLELTIEKIDKGEEHPILLHVSEIDDKGHKVGNIRTAIDVMKRTDPPFVKAHEKKKYPYEVKITKEGLTYLLKELDTWDRIEKLVPINTLTRHSLKIIREITYKLKRLLEGSVIE